MHVSGFAVGCRVYNVVLRADVACVMRSVVPLRPGFESRQRQVLWIRANLIIISELIPSEA